MDVKRREKRDGLARGRVNKDPTLMELSEKHRQLAGKMEKKKRINSKKSNVYCWLLSEHWQAPSRQLAARSKENML